MLYPKGDASKGHHNRAYYATINYCGYFRGIGSAVPGAKGSSISWSHRSTTDAWRSASGRVNCGSKSDSPFASLSAITTNDCRYRSYKTLPWPTVGISIRIGSVAAHSMSRASTSPSIASSYSASRYGAWSGPENNGWSTHSSLMTSFAGPLTKYDRVPRVILSLARSMPLIGGGAHFARYSLAKSTDIDSNPHTIFRRQAPFIQRIGAPDSLRNCIVQQDSQCPLPLGRMSETFGGLA